MKKLISVLLFFILVISPGLAFSRKVVAIIINKENSFEEISMVELKNIFKHERKYWRDGKPIYFVTRQAESKEKEIVLKRIFEMDDRQLRMFWIRKIYNGDMAVFPKILYSDESIKKFVSAVPNAIGFIDADHIDGSVKVLRINGKMPDEAGYPISDMD